MKAITVKRSPLAGAAFLVAMLAVHLALCHRGATRRGYPPIHPFWETIAPVLIYFASGLVPFFDDRPAFRRKCRRLFVPTACLITAIVVDNLGSGRPSGGHLLGMFGLFAADIIPILIHTGMIGFFVYPLTCALDEIANLFWSRCRDFSDDAHAPFLRFSTRGLLAGVAGVCVLLAFCGWAYPLYLTWPRGELTHRCNLNLRKIGLAISNYQALYGTYPPAYIADASGRPAHSWRVLLLPLLDEQDLYDAYRFDEPWNGPHNRELAKRMPSVYRCAWNFDRRSTETSYVVVTGPETMFPGAQARAAPPADRNDNTLLVVELADSGIHWLEPRDVEFAAIDFDSRTGPNGYLRFSHAQDDQHSVRGSCADGHWFRRDEVTGETLRAYLTADGGESIADEQ